MLRVALIAALMLAAATRDAPGATIFVTSLEQKISSIGGCSLQEAIYSSALRTNEAIDSALPDHFIVTQCVPGTGDDTVVLPTRGVFQLSNALAADAYNFMGPTATPIIFSTITIEGNGATLEWTGTGTARLFAVGPASIAARLGTVSGTGKLTLRNVYVKGFRVKGGDGADGGGGGLGAGGAIYVVNGGSLTVENGTFDSNSATGGNGTAGGCGGGGGLAGNGGRRGFLGGGGGGGSRGNGGTGTASTDQTVGYGGGGGGTVTDGDGGAAGGAHGGSLCGGAGGVTGNDGVSSGCPGGGGGGSGADITCHFCGPNGGNGNYGGGGGGGDASGGNGGFGGGGGQGCAGPGAGHGGNGGFGGGGGGGTSYGNGGGGGPLGGGASTMGTGGGGGAAGGAIFNDSGSVTVQNSTFTNNVVVRGTGGGAGADNGADAGGAIFSRNGSLSVVDATISGNQSTGSGGGIVVWEDGSPTSFTLDDTIIANDGANECFVFGSVTAGGAGNLIMSNGSGGAAGACPGVVTNGDPQLGPLQYNQGFTPTVAIPTTSPAFNAADSATSLPTDQRGQVRPAPGMGGVPDIGAFELCLTGPPFARMPCVIPGGIEQAAALTVQVSPDGGGTTTPAAGTSNEPLNSVIVLTATPNPGFGFLNWTGNVADQTSASTTVVMDQDQTVAANFGVTPPTTTTTTTVHGTSSTTTTTSVHGSSSTTTTSATVSVPPCVLSLLPESSIAGVECAVAAVRRTLNEPPQPICGGRCHCALEPALDRIGRAVTRADTATSPKKCTRSLKAAWGAAKSLHARVGSVARRKCLASVDRAATLDAETMDLASRTRALSKSSFCASK